MYTNYIDIFKSNILAVMLVGNNNEVLQVNDVCCNLLQIRRGDIIGTNWVEKHINPQDLDRMHSYIKTHSKVLEKKPKRFEIIVKINNSDLNLIIYLTHNTKKSCVAEFIDVSEQKRQENKFKTIVETMNEVITEIDLNGIITYTSPSTLKVFGYEPSYFIGKNCLKHLHPDYVDTARKILTETLTSSSFGNSSIICKHEHKDKGYIWCQASGNVLKNKDGIITGVIIVVRDISDLINFQKCLKEQKDKYETIVNTMTEMILEIDNDGIILFASPNTSTILGVENFENYIGQLCLSGINVSDMLNFIMSHDEIKSGKKTQDLIKYKYSKPNGDHICIEASTSPLFSDGKFVSTLLVGRDVTEQEKAITELRINEEKLRYVYDNTSEAIFVAQDGKIVFCNKMTETLIGRKSENILGMGFDKFIHFEDRKLVVDRHFKRQQGINETNKYSFKVVTDNKDVKFVDLTTVRILWDENPATLNLVSDVTIRKLAEAKAECYKKELEIKNIQYQNILDTLQEGFYEVDYDSNIIFFSKSALKCLKIEDFETIRNSPISDFFVNKEDHEKLKRLIIENGELCQYPTRIKDSSGNILDILITIKLLKDENGNYKGSYGTFKDISCIIEKQKEIELLYKVFENSQNALIVFGQDRIVKYANCAVCRLISPSENVTAKEYIVGKSVNTLIFPELISFDNIIEKIKEDGKWLGPARAFSLSDGSGTIPIDIIFSSISYEDEMLIVGSYYDTTEYKQLQKQVIEHAKNYVDLSNQMQWLSVELNHFEETRKSKIRDLEQSLESIFQGIKYNGQINK